VSTEMICSINHSNWTYTLQNAIHWK
jgi:hypothetical protein